MIYVSLGRLLKKGTKNPFSILNFFNIFDGKYFSHEILLHILNIHKKFHLLLGDAWKSYQQESFEHTNYYYYYFSILFFCLTNLWIFQSNLPLRYEFMTYEGFGCEYPWDFLHFHQIERELRIWICEIVHSCEIYGRVRNEWNYYFFFLEVYELLMILCEEICSEIRCLSNTGCCNAILENYKNQGFESSYQLFK